MAAKVAEGLEKGIDIGFEKGLAQRNREFITNLILKSSLTDLQIAEIANIEVDVVKAMMEELKNLPDASETTSAANIPLK